MHTVQRVLEIVKQKATSWTARSARQQRETQRVTNRSMNRIRRQRGVTAGRLCHIPRLCRAPLGLVAVVSVVVVCVQHLRNDVLIQDALIEYIGIPEHWLNVYHDEEQQVAALQSGQAILRGGLNHGGVLMDRSFLEHEVKALVDGEDGGAQQQQQHVDLQEQDEAWRQVERVFEKKDAQAQAVWWNAHKLVHVIHTRCLQNHPRLVDYTKARMDQFIAFTLPSMRHQTNDEFLWIIWTDPSLLPETEDKLKALVKPMHNAVVLGWKKTRPDIRSSWFQVVFDQSYIVHGSYKLLMSYHKAALSGHPTLDTYLDSDDALRSDFVQMLQDEAAVALAQPKAYRFWCPSHLIEWGFFSPPWQIQLLKEQAYYAKLQQQQQEQQKKQKKPASTIFGGHGQQAPPLVSQFEPGSIPEHVLSNISIKENGFFVSRHGTDKCLNSAGSTVGVSGNATLQKDFPIFASKDFWQDREQWHHTVMPCDHKGEPNCLGFMTAEEEVRLRHDVANPNVVQAKNVAAASHLKAVLLQSKTITAAATKSIAQVFAKRPKPSVEVAFEVQEVLWASLHATFGIVQQDVEDFRQDFYQSMDKVLLDMLTICLPSNACVAANKKILQDLLTTVGLKREKLQPQSAALPAASAVNDEETAGSERRR